MNSIPLARTAWVLAVTAGSRILAQPCSPVESGEFFGLKVDQYATDIAVEADVAVVGAPGTDSGEDETEEGALYIYRRVSGSWAFETLLTPADGRYLDMFGYQVEVSNGRLIITKTGWDQEAAGGVYVFVRSENGGWIQEAEFESPGDYEFGWTLAASADSFAVGAGNGAPEAAYVYNRGDDGQWTQEARLTLPGGGWWDFGGSLAMSGQTLAAGAGNWYDYSNGEAFVFAREPDGSWNLEATIVPPPDDAGPCYYTSVLLSADSLIVTASYGTSENPYAATRTFVYDRSAQGAWELKAELPMGEYAIDRGLLLRSIGGLVRVLRHQADGQWIELAAFTAHDTVPGDGFGYPMSVRGTQAIVAARQADPDPAVCLFDLPGCPPCQADLNGDGAVDFFDFLAFVNLFNTLDPVADCTTDGEHDLFDFLCYTNAFNAGC